MLTDILSSTAVFSIWYSSVHSLEFIEDNAKFAVITKENHEKNRLQCNLKQKI